MSLFDQVSDDIKAAMLARQKIRLEALRAIKTAFVLAKAETGAESLPAGTGTEDPSENDQTAQGIR